MTGFVNRKIEKDPDAYLDYAIDFTDWLAEVSDTIASATAIVDPDDSAAVEDVEVLGGNTVRVWVSGGEVGTTVALTVSIVTSNVPPRLDDRTVFLKIKER